MVNPDRDVEVPAWLGAQINKGVTDDNFTKENSCNKLMQFLVDPEKIIK